MLQLKQEFKVNLFRYIINNLEIYTLKEVPRSILAQYQQTNFTTEFFKNFEHKK